MKIISLKQALLFKTLKAIIDNISINIYDEVNLKLLNEILKYIYKNSHNIKREALIVESLCLNFDKEVATLNKQTQGHITNINTRILVIYETEYSNNLYDDKKIHLKLTFKIVKKKNVLF